MTGAVMHYDLVALLSPYLVIFARISALFLIAPGFGDHTIPARYRLLFALALSVVLKDALPEIPLPSHHFSIMGIIVQEVLVGSLMGAVARFFLSLLDILGSIMGMQIGLGNAAIFNPSLSHQTTVVEQFVVTSGVMLFMAIDGHHALLQSIIKSYDVFFYTPPHDATHEVIGFSDFLPAIAHLPKFFEKSFALACQIALPFFILGLLFQVILGLINRIVPSIQVFFIALPLQILLGFLLMSMTVGLCLYLSMEQFLPFYESFFKEG